MRTFLLLIFLATNAAAMAPGSCRPVPASPPAVSDGWLLLAALVVWVAGRWSR